MAVLSSLELEISLIFGRLEDLPALLLRVSVLELETLSTFERLELEDPNDDPRERKRKRNTRWRARVVHEGDRDNEGGRARVRACGCFDFDSDGAESEADEATEVSAQEHRAFSPNLGDESH